MAVKPTGGNGDGTKATGIAGTEAPAGGAPAQGTGSRPPAPVPPPAAAFLKPGSVAVQGLWRPKAAPETPPAVGQIPAAAWVDGLGLVRMHAIRKEHGKEGTNYEIHLVFPNFTELTFEVSMNNKGHMEAVPGKKFKPKFRDSQGQVHERGVSVVKEAGTTGGFAVDLSGAVKQKLPPLKVSLSSHEPGAGEIRRPSLHSMAQPEDLTPFIVIMRAPAVPEVTHAEKVKNRMPPKDMDGSISTHGLWLSNGDYIEVSVWHDHHTGKYKAVSAGLSPFFAADPTAIIPLSIEGEGQVSRTSREKTLRVRGQGYDISVKVKPPLAGSGDMSLAKEGVSLKKHPPFGLEMIPDAAVAKAAEPHAVDKASGSGRSEEAGSHWLIPDEDSARLLNQPPWDDRIIELRFQGRIAGGTISRIPLMVRGRFIQGAFVPEFSASQQIKIFSDEGKEVNFELTAQGGTLQVAVITDPAADAKVILASQNVGRALVFSDGQIPLHKLASKIYDFRPLAPQDIPQDDWSPVSDEVYAELKRFLNGSSGIPRDAITSSSFEKDLIRIFLNGDKSLFLRRSETEEEIVFSLVPAKGVPDTLTGFLGLGQGLLMTIEGFFFGNPEDLGTAKLTDRLLEVFDERHGHWLFADSEYPTFQADLDQESPALSIRLPKLTGTSHIRGRLVESSQNGHRNLLFALENGHTLKLNAEITSDESLFMTLVHLSDAPRGPIPDYVLEEKDAQGQMIRKGLLVDDSGEWAVSWEDGTKQDFSLNMKDRHVVVQMGEAVEAEALPWHEGDFVIPTSATRSVMQKVLQVKTHPKDGDRDTFHFMGDPVGGERSSDLGKDMRELGDKATRFFGWVIKLKMVFDKKYRQWRPLSEGIVEMQRRTPVLGTDGVTVTGNRLEQGQYRYSLVDTPTGWGLKLANGKVLHSYRVGLEDEASRIRHFSPDFALSFGPPNEKARSTFHTTEKNAQVIKKIPSQKEPDTDISIEAHLGDGSRAQISTVFWSPIFRAHTAPVNGNFTLLEFSPGYSREIKSLRFTRLTLEDGNGLKFELIFQHIADRVEVVGARAMGENVLQDLFIGKEGERSYLQGVIPAAYRFTGTSSYRSSNIPIEVNWAVKDGDMQIEGISLGFNPPFAVEGLHFNARSGAWDDLSKIEKSREGTNLTVTVTRVQGRDTGGERNLPEVLHHDEHVFLPPEEMKALARAQNAQGDALPSMISVRFRNTDKRLGFKEIEIPFMYNDRLQTYEPRATGEFLFAKIDGAQTSLSLSQSRTERNWYVTFPDGKRAFVGNFFINESEGGRPIPLMWFSTARDPHRRFVNYYLEDRGLARGAVNSVFFDPAHRPDFEMEIQAGGHKYVIPLRAKVKTDGNFLVVPRSTALRSEDGGYVPRALSYYQAQAGTPAVIEFDGYAYEVEILHKGTAPQVSLRQTHPGASGVYTDSRARMSILLEPEDQSALLLLDVDNSNFMEDVGEQMAVEDPKVHRVLWDALSNAYYEMALVLDDKLPGRVLPRGFALLDGDEARIVGDEYLLHRGRVYIHTRDGYYISFSSFPSHTLQVASHGRTLEAALLARTWTPLSSDETLFDKRLPFNADPKKKSSPYKIPEVRAAAYKELAEEFGIEGDNIWDLRDEFPKGMGIEQQKPEPSRPKRRVFIRKGGLCVEVEVDGPVPQEKNLQVKMGNKIIPAHIWHKHDRYYLVLDGPLHGVVFYWQQPTGSMGTYRLVELTHYKLREALESDLGPEVSQSYNPTRHIPPNRDASIALQMARTRLWRLRQEGLLPRDPLRQLDLSSVLIPYTDVRIWRTPPLRLRTLEQIAENPILKKLVGDGLNRADASSDVWVGHLDRLVAGWRDFQNERDAARQADKHNAMILALAQFAGIPVTGVAHEARQRILSTHDRVRTFVLGTEVINGMVFDIFGSKLQDYVKEYSPLENLEHLSEALIALLDTEKWLKLKDRIIHWEAKEGILSLFEEIGVLAAAAQDEIQKPLSPALKAEKIAGIEEFVNVFIPDAQHLTVPDPKAALAKRERMMEHLFPMEPVFPGGGGTRNPAAGSSSPAPGSSPLSAGSASSAGSRASLARRPEINRRRYRAPLRARASYRAHDGAAGRQGANAVLAGPATFMSRTQGLTGSSGLFGGMQGVFSR